MDMMDLAKGMLASKLGGDSNAIGGVMDSLIGGGDKMDIGGLVSGLQEKWAAKKLLRQPRNLAPMRDHCSTA